MDTAITTRDPFADLRGLTVEALEQESTRLHETIADEDFCRSSAAAVIPPNQTLVGHVLAG